MKKVVLKIYLYDNRAKQKAMKAVSSVSGIDFIAMDMNEKKMTVIGEVDPVDVAGKLRKFWHTDIVFVGPPEEANNKEEEGNNKEKEKEKEDIARNLVMAAIKGAACYNNPYGTTRYYLESVGEDNPNACVIS
ncbi:heavy metal-associated isoprenylated plant protein 39-like [Telopea speciosissima]|uniref:heavy metal-associated isoprenylated plant protein 39-like n=1 Tax=Telopea speciosissima TaxID=54955 RepID=UPI001CC5A475|nr:heavy metal-associated isoprenylated plant protein 39-like [Telopea speciosissima]